MPAAGRQPKARRPALWFEQAAILAIAAGLDFCLGDPWGWPHPVQVMGWGIGVYSQAVFKVIKAPIGQRLAGIVLGVGLIVGSGLTGWALLWLARVVQPGMDLLVGAVLLASCFAGRSLRRAAEDVLQPLQHGDLAAARQQLSRYVGRDTADLNEAEILRAVMETVTENATDGVLAPLFYALVGAFLPGVGSVPLALAYKAASTLDSMVGYREAPYTDLGWFSARLEDGLTWLPCRLVVVTIGLLSGQPGRVWRICRRDAIADPSPNAGWSECAYAATLGVQLGGPNRYRGVIKVKPKLADDLQPITPDLIRQAMDLTRSAFLIGLCSAVAGLIGRGLLNLR
ncbi:cobalamin biosynthesis protein [Pseudanabaena sp. FACHB-2040]|nr:cobalamin biosynthesis protein [Pseudanabaena sp. FACHB-2040]